MEQKEPFLTPYSLCEELILVDEEYLNMLQGGESDLYMQLVKEPALVKKESLKYDYSLNLNIHDTAEFETYKTEGSENVGEKVKEAHRGIKCHCSKTKCQKNYCDCFKARVACGQECQCLECCNDEASRKLLPNKSSGSGCKCQKRHCLKNYCECHSGGKKCSVECRCFDCHNIEEIFGESRDERNNLGEPKKKLKKEVLGEASIINLFKEKVIESNCVE